MAKQHHHLENARIDIDRALYEISKPKRKKNVKPDLKYIEHCVECAMKDLNKFKKLASNGVN